MTVNTTRVTTIGSDVTISGGSIALHRIIGEEASTAAVLLKTAEASPVTKASLAPGAVPLAGGVNFGGAEFPLGLIVNIAVTGKNLLVVWSPV